MTLCFGVRHLQPELCAGAGGRVPAGLCVVCVQASARPVGPCGQVFLRCIMRRAVAARRGQGRPLAAGEAAGSGNAGLHRQPPLCCERSPAAEQRQRSIFYSSCLSRGHVQLVPLPMDTGRVCGHVTQDDCRDASDRSDNGSG